MGTPPEPKKPSRMGGLLKAMLFVGVGAVGSHFLWPAEKPCVQDTAQVERGVPEARTPAVTEPAPEVKEEAEVRTTSRVIHQPKNPNSTAIYNELNRWEPDIATIQTHLDNGGDLTDRFSARPLFVHGLMRAASLGNTELADFVLARATPELLSFRTSNGVNLLKLMAGRDSEGGVAVFQKTLDAMKAAGVEGIGDKDVYDWHLAHTLAFHGNEGALRIVINDTETFGDPQAYLTATTRPYDNGQERNRQVVPGKTPLQLAQRQLEGTVEGSNIAISSRERSLCEGEEIPAESEAKCAEMNATLAAAAERIQAERGRLQGTIALIQETLG